VAKVATAVFGDALGFDLDDTGEVDGDGKRFWS